MARKLSEAEQKGIKNLMKGAPLDKTKAENMLLEQSPDDLSPDILDPWLKSRSKFDRQRLDRVLEAWGMTKEEWTGE
jgi:hypothetical protein